MVTFKIKSSSLPARININHQIQARELRVLDESGNNLGVLSKEQAMSRAVAAGLDLIEISPRAVPPVAKIMDYGKYQYLENKKTKQAKGKMHFTETKALQIKIGTGDHDLEMKAGKASHFLQEGHRVKINLFLPGRAKYLDPKFLQSRIERFLKFIPESHKVADPPQKSPKGWTLVIERAK